jgi:NitT/TauT family transport system permease protein
MLFKLRGELPARIAVAIQLIGFIMLIGAWEAIARMGLVTSSLMPAPSSIIMSFRELHFEDALLRNLGYSVKLNLLGYFEAIAIAVPLGFIIGLFPLFRELSRKYVDAMRFVPLTALTGLFIAWFGIGTEMKVHFLAFGIIVYLLPVVVQRISEVDKVYCDMVYTIGASSWQTIRYVFMPSVLSKLLEDIRILTAISWTYIIVAELVNKSDGGVGALAFTAARQSRIDKVFAILLVIIAVGFVQDKVVMWLDKHLFPYKV